MENKESPLGDRMNTLWKQINFATKRALLVLKTTDFGNYGLNEARFKGLIVFEHDFTVYLSDELTGTILSTL